MTGKVTAAVVEAEGLAGVRELTDVVIRDAQDSGRGHVVAQRLHCADRAVSAGHPEADRDGNLR